MLAAQLLKILRAGGKSFFIVYSSLPDVFRRHQNEAARHVVQPEPIATKWRNTVGYGVSRLKEDERDVLEVIIVSFSDSEHRHLREVYYLASRLPTAETRGNSSRYLDSLFVMATMSRMPGISGSYDNFHFHPPGYLSRRLITSRDARTQALNAVISEAMRADYMAELDEDA